MKKSDATGVFYDKKRQVNNNIMIGKYYSQTNFLFRWLQQDLSFLHIDRNRSSVYLPYVLRRIGTESAFRNYVR
jgi:hypothetical protein